MKDGKVACDNNALISVKPNYAEAILSGEKTIELRRRMPAIDPGTRLWIYATRPIGAVVGVATVQRIVKGTPTEIWDQFMERTAVCRCTFEAYFAGTNHALGLVLSEVVRSGSPVDIGQLREMREGFHPPRILARLTLQETLSLQRLAFGDAPVASQNVSIR